MQIKKSLPTLIPWKNKMSLETSKDNTIDISQMQLFALMRYLHLAYDLKNNIGNEENLYEHPLRFGQDATLSFQEKQVHRVSQMPEKTKVQIQGFGMLGSNGVLPIHITEASYEKKLHEKNTAFNDFLDIFHHRLISLFYKAWLMSEPVIMLDNGNNKAFSNQIASFVGSAIDQHDKDYEKLAYDQFYYSSLLLSQHMPLDNLQEILNCYFKIPIKIKQNIGQWIDSPEHSTIISHHSEHRLGQGLLIGTRYYDITQKFRVVIGPIGISTYLRFLKNGDLAQQLNIWIYRYIKHNYIFDIELVVDKNEVLPMAANGFSKLGQTSWLGKPKINPNIVL